MDPTTTQMTGSYTVRLQPVPTQEELERRTDSLAKQVEANGAEIERQANELRLIRQERALLIDKSFRYIAIGTATVTVLLVANSVFGNPAKALLTNALLFAKDTVHFDANLSDPL